MLIKFILKFEASSNGFFFKGMVKKGYCDETRFIPILVIKIELFKKFMWLILTSISSILSFVKRIESKGITEIFTENLFSCVSLIKSLEIV